MNCYQHPDAAAAATCVACNKPICAECREEVAGHPMCQPCVAAAAARLAQDETPATAGVPATAPAPSLHGQAATADVYSSAAITSLDTSSTPCAPEVVGKAPGPVRRILRGIGWGLLYGQWWTLWMIISAFIWNFSDIDGGVILLFVFMGIVYAFFGSLTGLIIGASNASLSAGTGIGVGIGILACLLRMALTHSFNPVSLVWYYFTGRYVGAGITSRVQRPLLPKGYTPGAPVTDRVVEAQEPTSAA